MKPGENIAGAIHYLCYSVMKALKTYLLPLMYLLQCGVYAQSAGICRMDSVLSERFDSLVSADAQLRYDSLAPQFLETMLLNLRSEEALKCRFESLARRVMIISSPDRKLRFFSWDERSGGTWHAVQCVVQYKGDDGVIRTVKLSNEAQSDSVDFTDSGIYLVYEYDQNGKKRYLCFATGSHGAGHSHRIVRVFQFSGKELEVCPDCLDGHSSVVIEHPRSEETALQYHPDSKSISYKEFVFNTETGFYENSGKTIHLKLK